MGHRIQVLSSAQEIAQVAADWDALARDSGSPLNAAVWHENACRHVHPSCDRPHVLLLWDGKELLGVAPLVLAGGSGRRRYEIIGSRTLYEPASILARNAAAADRLAAAMLSLGLPLALIRLPGESPFGEQFKARARRRGVLLSPRASGSPYVDLRAGWEAYYSGLPSRLRNIVRRGERQLARTGRVDFEAIRPGASGAGGLLTEAFEVERRSWKGRAGSAVLLRPELHQFFMHYGTDLARRGELLVSMLRLDGAAVAMQVANVSHGAYWQLKIGYDEAHARQLVGLQLQMATLRWACEQGLERYEFLGTAEPWIREWTPAVHDYRTMFFYPFSSRGLTALVGDHLVRLRGRFRRKARSGTASQDRPGPV